MKLIVMIFMAFLLSSIAIDVHRIACHGPATSYGDLLICKLYKEAKNGPFLFPQR